MEINVAYIIGRSEDNFCGIRGLISTHELSETTTGKVVSKVASC